MTSQAFTSEQSLGALAREKLVRVLGEGVGGRVFSETLSLMQLDDLRTADELYAFGDKLVLRGGFEAAVGRLLSVAAVMRGAKGSS